MMNFEAVIGLEVHVELATKSKMFCGCEAIAFGTAPNMNVCPVCLGLPGALPVINEQAINFTAMAALALNCSIQPLCFFARKNYFYPDLPKGYQISQYELPLSKDGFLDIEVEGKKKKIGITRVHLEEDTGKLLHLAGKSLIDLNRAGIPLMEIVTDPDMRSADEAYAYVIQLRQIIRYLGISSGDMEKGAMRCEVNLSLRPHGAENLGTKVEIKNLNSFRSVRNSIAYEIDRQRRLLASEDEVRQVTMGWDENAGVTREQRSKEFAHDYRYFPDPDLPPLNLDHAWIENLRSRLPELPADRIMRYVQTWHIKTADAKVLVEDMDVADYFERAVMHGIGRASPQAIANWIIGEIKRQLNETGQNIRQIKLFPEHLVELVELLDAHDISTTVAKEALGIAWQTGQSPKSIVEGRGLRQISIASDLSGLVAQVIRENPEPVAQYRKGKVTIIKFLVGQAMRATRGKANPQLVEKLLIEILKSPEEG